MGSRGIAVLHNIGAIWGVGGQRHVPAALHPGLTRRLGGPQAGLESAEILAPRRRLFTTAELCMIAMCVLVMSENKKAKRFVDVIVYDVPCKFREGPSVGLEVIRLDCV